MKKCTKKIPKHNAGAIVGNSLNFVGDMTQNVIRSQNEGVSFGSVLGGMGKGAATGAALGSVIPGIGTIIGGIGGAVIGGVTSAVGQSGSVDENTGEVTKSSGLTRLFGWGRSDKSLYAKSNRIKTSNVDKLLTPYMNEQFMSDPYNNLNTNVYVNAAEGGIVPGEHYASRREVEVAADGTNAVRYPWDPDGKDTYHVYTNPDGSSAMGNYVFTEEGVRRPNGEKYSDAAEKIIKGTEEGSKLRQIELRKLANEMEEQKMNKGIKKIKKGIPAHEGGKNGTTLDLSDMFLYRQKDGKFVMQDINGNRYDVPEMMLPYIQGDEHGYWFGPQTGVAPSAGKWNGSMNFAKQMLNSKNVAKLRNTMTKVLPKGAKPANINGPVKPVTGTSPDVLGKPKTVQEAAQMARNERTANMWQQITSKGSVPQKTLEGPQTWSTARGSSNLWENPMALQSGDDIASAINTAYYLNKGLPTALGVSAILGGGGTFLLHEATKGKQPTTANTDKSAVVTAQGKPVEPVATSTEASTENEKKEVVVPKKSSINKPSSSKKTAVSRATTSAAQQEEKLTPEQIAESLRIQDIGERHWLRGSVSEPNQSLASLAQTTPGKLKIQKLAAPSAPKTHVDDNDSTNFDTNLGDLAYKAAVLTQPLWGKAKAEPVNYDLPYVNFVPTSIDVTNDLANIDRNAAAAQYDLANRYRNTGAGLAATLQLAQNRSAQQSAIRQWQTNAQNELIGKNVGIYNDWSKTRTGIMNDVYDKVAQNKAAARNINRQNVATALKNWGQIRRDEKLQDVQSSALNMYAPAIKAVMEDPYSVLNPLYNLNR